MEDTIFKVRWDLLIKGFKNKHLKLDPKINRKPVKGD